MLNLQSIVTMANVATQLNLTNLLYTTFWMADVVFWCVSQCFFSGKYSGVKNVVITEWLQLNSQHLKYYWQIVVCCVLQGLFSTALHSHEEGPVWIFAKLQHHTHLQQSEGRHLKFIHFTPSFHLSGKLSDIQNVVYNKLVKISCVATFAIVTIM